MTCRTRLVLVLIAAAGLVGLAPARGWAQEPAPVQSLLVRTVPPIEGVQITTGTELFTTDRSGQAQVLVPAVSSVRQITDDLEVRGPAETRRGVKVRFHRWYGNTSALTATLDVYYRVTPAFTDQLGTAIDSKRVTSMTLKSSTGRRRKVTGHHPVWLHGSRVVSYATGASKEIAWSIQSVIVDGSNVVNRAQQRFFPNREHRVSIPLLFYSTTFSARDALFGFPIGSAVRLRYPDGTERSFELGDGAQVTLPSLPRGDYEVSVDGPGLSFTRPVSVSREQQVDLSVVSTIDILVVLLAVAVVALALLLVGRPDLRTRIRESRRVGSVLAGLHVVVTPTCATVLWAAYIDGWDTYVAPNVTLTAAVCFTAASIFVIWFIVATIVDVDRREQQVGGLGELVEPQDADRRLLGDAHDPTRGRPAPRDRPERALQRPDQWEDPG